MAATKYYGPNAGMSSWTTIEPAAISESDLPAAREYAADVVEAFLRGDFGGYVYLAELVEGAYLDGLADGRKAHAGDYEYGRYAEMASIVEYIRGKVAEGRASVETKQLGGFLRAVALEQLETFDLLAEAIERGEHVNA